VIMIYLFGIVRRENMLVLKLGMQLERRRLGYNGGGLAFCGNS
jgi:hypothetical protein